MHRAPPGLVFAGALLATAALACVFPEPLVKWGGLETRTLIVPIVQFVMFAMGTRVSVRDLGQALAMPRVVAAGLALQYLIMPFGGAALAGLFELPAEVAAGVILLGSVCAGASSNVMTYFAGGNLALSVTMTTISTLLSPLITPALMQLLAGRAVPVRFGTLSWSIVRIVVVPVLAGLIAERILRRWKPAVERWLPRLVIFAVCLVNAIVTANSRDALLSIGPALVAVEIIHNLGGYALGFLGAKLMGMGDRECIAMAMQVGIRNGGMSTGLAYDVLKSGPAALASVVYGTIQNASGALVAWLWRRYGASRPPGSDRESDPGKGEARERDGH